MARNILVPALLGITGVGLLLLTPRGRTAPGTPSAPPATPPVAAPPVTAPPVTAPPVTAPPPNGTGTGASAPPFDGGRVTEPPGDLASLPERLRLLERANAVSASLRTWIANPTDSVVVNQARQGYIQNDAVALVLEMRRFPTLARQADALDRLVTRALRATTTPPLSS